eukprot:9593404-Alexandrium_andersonii.AAC.1
MSASLVGSEMCIRDRPPKATPARAGGALWGGAAALPGATAPPGSPPKAVSYTHLTLPTICSV